MIRGQGGSLALSSRMRVVLCSIAQYYYYYYCVLLSLSLIWLNILLFSYYYTAVMTRRAQRDSCPLMHRVWL